MQHMCTMAAITPQVRTVCTLENLIPENQPGKLSCGQSLVSCSDCMQTWQMSVECDHAQKRYLQTCTTSNSHCLIASLDARSTSSSLHERINKEAITLFPKEKATTGDTCKCHPEKQDMFYMIGWGMKSGLEFFLTEKFHPPAPVFFPQTCHIPYKLNLKEKASFIKLL